MTWSNPPASGRAGKVTVKPTVRRSFPRSRRVATTAAFNGFRGRGM